MRHFVVLCAVALCAVAAMVPAAQARDFTIRAGGIVFDNNLTGSTGTFSINLKAGPGHKVTYMVRDTGLAFHSTKLLSLKFTRTAVMIVGLGMVNGRQVRFTAYASDHPARVDGFRIAWEHKASHGGNLLNGNVHVRQLKLS
jgi:hypothetical protein